MLSFKLLELKSELYLRITNTGKSAANDIAIEIKKIENNGDRNELNILAHRSLHDDLQSVKDGENTSTVIERLDVIKNRS